MLVVIAVGLLDLLSLPSFVWVMVISGLIQFTQEKEQEKSTRQPKSTSMLVE